MNNVARSVLFLLMLGSQAGLVAAQDQSAPKPAARADPAEGMTARPHDKQNKRGHCGNLKSEDCNFVRVPKPKGGPCQGTMCPPGRPESKRPLEELTQPRQSGTR
ncbi:hypothetical protein E7V67_000830 [[Empedobacter] haloabium]|uniref:Secreted protein n=1 Tax=[Empedobacter] haloabium TaxID=592317 RepID=A0ABZ1UNM8_9BURK